MPGTEIDNTSSQFVEGASITGTPMDGNKPQPQTPILSWGTLSQLLGNPHANLTNARDAYQCASNSHAAVLTRHALDVALVLIKDQIGYTPSP